MIKRSRRVWVLTLMALLLAVTLGGCETSNVRIGFVGTNRPNLIEARYERFTSTESQTQALEPGDSLVLAYEAEVEEGELTFQLLDEEGDLIWQVELDQDAADQVELVAEQGGTYRVVVTGDDARGSYRVAWEVEG